MSISENIRKLKAVIPDHVEIIAVSKRKPIVDIMQAYEAGHRIFGENRVQELIEKATTSSRGYQLAYDRPFANQ